MKKINFKIVTLFILVAFISFLFVNCSDDDSVASSEEGATEETTEEETVVDDPNFVATDWTTETPS